MNCDQLRETLRQALAKYDYIEFALLFGSMAEGRALAMSDREVLIRHRMTNLDLARMNVERAVAILEEAG